MDSGEFDRTIEIHKRSVTRDTDGGELVSWKKKGKYWAKLKWLRSTERYASAQIRESKSVTFTIRFVDDVTPDDRILYNSEYYRITGLAEMGRKKYIEISAEFLQGMGEAI